MPVPGRGFSSVVSLIINCNIKYNIVRNTFHRTYLHLDWNRVHVAGMICAMPGQSMRSLPLDFACRAGPVISRVRDALGEIVAGIPGFTYRRPNDLAVRLGLNPKLAWSVGRSLEGTDHFAAAQFIPGPTGMRVLLNAAKRVEVSRAVLDRARDSFDAFRELVREHAGARKHFNMLVAGLAVTNREQADIEHRRLLFDGSTYLWGVQARTIFWTYIAKPSADGENYDLIVLRGIVDFTRMRSDGTWRLRLVSSTDDADRTHASPHPVRLDPFVQGPVPLLKDFCSRPLPEFRACTQTGVPREFECVADSVGNTTRMTCVVGEYLNEIEPRYRQPDYHDFRLQNSIRTPARRVICDLLIHRDLFPDDVPPTADLCSDLFSYGIVVKYDAKDHLPMNESVQRLGTAAEIAFTAEIPGYPEMLRYALQQVGWNGDEFNFHRFSMQYPPIHTTLQFSRPLPERAAGGARGEAPAP